ncbi:spore coat U domain-containing protein [Methylococcus sp. ANG]|uniref:Csu type fimbrial protein n=1 Tax=Methylococcus sp. ANG TaxID=3231903 RepID=UPI0034592B27
MNILVSKHAFLRRTAGFASLAAAIVFVAGAGTAEAATATANVGVSAVVVAGCKIETLAPVAFGNYDPTETAAVQVSNGQIRVKCTRSATAYPITLSAGTGSGATCTGTPVRKMTLGANSLAYNLYQGGYTTVWGCDTSNDYEYTATTSGWTSIDIYGEIPAEQDVPAGTYNDTVVATVTF